MKITMGHVKGQCNKGIVFFIGNKGNMQCIKTNLQCVVKYATHVQVQDKYIYIILIYIWNSSFLLVYNFG